MRRLVPLVAAVILILSVAAGVGMIVAAVLVQPPPLTAPTARGSVAVQRFYAAANDVIATGDVSVLPSVVAPHFVDREPIPGVSLPGREGLAAYLGALHQATPRLRLAPDVIAAAGDLAVVRVAVESGEAPAPFGGAVAAPAPWGSVDVFRIADGMIVERWSHMDGLALIRPLAQTSLDLPPAPAPRVITIDRFTLAPGAAGHARGTGPHLFYLEEGALRIQATMLVAEPDPGSPHEQYAGPHRPAELLAHRTASLSAGQSLPAPAGALVTMTNVDAGTTRVVAATFSFVLPQAGTPPRDARPPGVVGQTRAGGVATDVRVGPATVALGQATLARGAQLTVSSAEGPTLIAVDAGELGIVASQPAWLRSGVHGMVRRAHEASLAPGDGALFDPGGSAVLRNAGDDPVIALILTLRPSPSVATAVPAP